MSVQAQREGGGIAPTLLQPQRLKWGWSAPLPGRFTSDKYILGTHRTGCWMGPMAELGGQGKASPRRDSFPGPSNP